MDTYGLSAMAHGDPRLQPVLATATGLAIPVIAIDEYRYGIAQSRHRARYEKWLNELIATCRVLGMDEETASEYALVRGELKRGGRLIPGNDVWIAALARQHAMPVLSRDVYFDAVRNVRRISW